MKVNKSSVRYSFIHGIFRFATLFSGKVVVAEYIRENQLLHVPPLIRFSRNANNQMNFTRRRYLSGDTGIYRGGFEAPLEIKALHVSPKLVYKRSEMLIYLCRY